MADIIINFKKLSLLFIIGFSTVILYGQNLKGKIIDENNNPVSDAYILNLRTGIHTHSSNFGYFSVLNVKFGDTIKFNCFGYKIKTLVLSDEILKKDIVVSLSAKSVDIDEVIIHESIKSLNVFSDIDIQHNPVNSSQEVLRTVPGLIIGQHAGGGKAEQIFLRGFDNDHGTDINISVDGIPVNLISHAHGQGYADLHFLIPEMIDKIDFGKGPYYSDKGNFTTTAYVEFKTKNRLENNYSSVEYGDFNTFRNVMMLNLVDNNRHYAYAASEFLMSDGAFESPQNFNRINISGKYSYRQNNKIVSVLLSHFRSKWNASGQIPQRAIDAGLISRFGSIDDTEGGNTGRSNFAINYTDLINEDLFVKSKLFYSKYDFELYSNFTFFLNDSINGDQIKQKENRTIFGGQTEINKNYKNSSFDINTKLAAGFLINKIYNDELSHTVERKYLINQLSLGDINETNLYSYFNTEFDFGKLLINPSFRIDYIVFDYVDKLDSIYENKVTSGFVPQPKLNFVYNFNKNIQLYLKTGIGFHSNDTRVSVADTQFGSLPKAYGADFGGIYKLTKNIMINAAVWYLFLEQEFVYVGDEAVVEPSGQTERKGIDFGLRYQINDYLFLSGDFTYSHARSIEEPDGNNHIPLAPVYTGTGGLFLRDFKGFSGGIQFRNISDRPANEDYSITAKGYTIADVNLMYAFKKIDFGFSIENVFNAEWNETQFATETRLFNEANSVEEIHFIPGTPFFLKAKIAYRF